MPILDRAQIKEPVLPKETVEVPALGGEVVVRGLLLSERLEISAMRRSLGMPLPGETEAEADSRAAARSLPVLLARTVVLADGNPLWTVEQWEQFGAVHSGDALHLFDVAMRLAGFNAEATEKN